MNKQRKLNPYQIFFGKYRKKGYTPSQISILWKIEKEKNNKKKRRRVSPKSKPRKVVRKIVATPTPKPRKVVRKIVATPTPKPRKVVRKIVATPTPKPRKVVRKRKVSLDDKINYLINETLPYIHKDHKMRIFHNIKRKIKSMDHKFKTQQQFNMFTKQQILIVYKNIDKYGKLGKSYGNKGVQTVRKKYRKNTNLSDRFTVLRRASEIYAKNNNS